MLVCVTRFPLTVCVAVAAIGGADAAAAAATAAGVVTRAAICCPIVALPLLPPLQLPALADELDEVDA